MSGLLNEINEKLGFKSYLALLFCGLQFTSVVANAQEAIGENTAVFKTQILQARQAGQPRSKGELSCTDLDLPPIKKTVCRYLPIYEQAANIQAGILREFFGGRQPSNPDEAYVRVLNNGQLIFADTDSKMIQQIITYLPILDTLDTYVERRKVNIVVQILQLAEGIDDSAGFLIGAQYSGRGRQTVEGKDRVSTSSTGSLISFNFGFGNLVNTLLDVVLNNYKSRNDIKVVSSVPLVLTHGYQLGNATPYTKPVYVQTTSVSAVTEQEGIRFDGIARFHENVENRITIKDFSISVSQFEPNATKREGVVEGVEKFQSPPRDIELELGCSTAIRVINSNRKVQRKEKNLIFSSKTEETDSKKVFLFVIQAVSDSKGTQPSNNCSETVALPELPVQK